MAGEVLEVFVEENPIMRIHQRFARWLNGMPLYQPLHVLRDIGLEARMDDVGVIPVKGTVGKSTPRHILPERDLAAAISASYDSKSLIERNSSNPRTL
jgi:hypothetical protein